MYNAGMLSRDMVQNAIPPSHLSPTFSGCRTPQPDGQVQKLREHLKLHIQEKLKRSWLFYFF